MASGLYNLPVIVPIKVVLPAPDGPMIANARPPLAHPLKLYSNVLYYTLPSLSFKGTLYVKFYHVKLTGF